MWFKKKKTNKKILLILSIRGAKGEIAQLVRLFLFVNDLVFQRERIIHKYTDEIAQRTRFYVLSGPKAQPIWAWFGLPNTLWETYLPEMHSFPSFDFHGSSSALDLSQLQPQFLSPNRLWFAYCSHLGLASSGPEKPWSLCTCPHR